jgi:non-ribosomal peptide synthetase component F
MEDRLRPVSRAGPVAAGGRVAPASFAQQRLWFLDQYMVSAPHAYNIPLAIRFRGLLEEGALKRTLDEIIQRHEILRTTFVAHSGQPMQVIAAHLDPALSVTDLSHLPASDRDARAASLARQEARQRFDLSQGPLLQAHLLRLAAEEHILLLTLHHIIADGWSVGVLQNELSTLYSAFSTDHPSPLPPLPIQYAQFAVWQHHHLQEKTLEDQLNYWRSILTNDLEPLALPTDFPRPGSQTFNGAQFPITLPQDLVEALKALGQEEGASLFIVLAAGFKTLLYRTSHQTDITIGTPIANRTRPEIEPLIGPFANTLVLRADLSGNPTVRELLRLPGAGRPAARRAAGGKSLAPKPGPDLERGAGIVRCGGNWRDRAAHAFPWPGLSPFGP